MQPEKTPNGLKIIKENKIKNLLISGIILIILVVMTYREAPQNGFVDWDDNEYVENNILVKSKGPADYPAIFSTVVSLNYQPLTILSLRINNNDCKDCPNKISAAPFIRTNIFLHLMNSFLVLLIIFRLSNKNIFIAFFTAAVFAIHPMHVESVAWVSARKDTLYAFFFLGGILSFMRFRNAAGFKFPWYMLTVALFVFSCLSKATAVVFPLVLLLIDFWMYRQGETVPFREYLKQTFTLKQLLVYLPLFIISVFFGLIAARLQGGHNFLGMFNFLKASNDVINITGNYSILQRFQVASYGFLAYIAKFFFPAGLSPFYPFPDKAEFAGGSFQLILWSSLIVIIVLLFLVIRSARKTRLYITSLGFYFVTLALVLQFISVGGAIMADRYTYIPYIGLAVIPAVLIEKLKTNLKKVFIVLAGLFIILLAVLSEQQIKIWHDSDTLWSRVIEKNPDLELARSARGKYLLKLSSRTTDPKNKRSLEDRALADFSVSIKLKSLSPDVYEGTGVILENRGDFKNALNFINKALSINDHNGRTFYNRAMVFDRLNNKEEAIRDYTTALRLDTGFAMETRSNRSVLYLETGKYKEAVDDLDYLISKDKTNHMYFYNRAFARLQIGDVDGAIGDYRKVLEMNPGDEETRRNLEILIRSRK